VSLYLILGLSLSLLVVFILLGVHIGVCLGFMSFIGIWLITGKFGVAISVLGTTAFQTLYYQTFAVIPLFILMGVFANLAGASANLYNLFNLLFGRLRGGLGMATVAANAVFAAVTGVSVASAAIFSKIALPQMLRFNYNKSFALGTVAGSSVLGMLIPPSILLIIYGMLSEEAIGKLFIAGIVPGIILSSIYMLGIMLIGYLRPQMVGITKGYVPPPMGHGGIGKVMIRSIGIVALIIITLGGIYAGVFTPTEASAVGALGALILVLINRRFTISGFWDALLETGYVSAAVFFLLISAQMYSRMLAVSGILITLTKFAAGLTIPPIAIIGIFIVIFIILGTILDSTSILLITMPLMLPIVHLLGFDLLWFGIVSIVAIELGLLTPPFGLVVYTVKAALGDEARLEEIFRGSFPFLLMMMIALAIIVKFPLLSTWLPNSML